ncbi:hypothetical protein MRY87_10155 [bacterium]|nr:hypothetical protein [bacterium]
MISLYTRRTYRRESLPLANLVKISLPLLTAILLGLSFWGVPVADPDLGWHLLGGEYVSLTGEAPRKDFINLLRGSWHDYHWLYQLLLFELFRYSSFSGLAIGFGVLSALFFGLLALTLMRQVGWRAGTIGFALIYLLLQPAWVLRPQSVALVLLFCCQLALEYRQRGTLLILLVSAVLLANMHVYWIFLPLLWLGYRVLPESIRFIKGLPSEEKISSLYGFLLLCGAALISPYGLFSQGADSLTSFLQNYALLWDYLSLQPEIKKRVAEMRTPFAIGGYIGPLVLLVLVFLSRRLSGARIQENIGRYFFLAITTLLALNSAKYLGLFAIALAFVWRDIVPQQEQNGSRWGKLVSVIAIVVILGSLSFLLPKTWRKFPENAHLTNQVLASYPVRTCAHLAQMRGKEEGPVRVLTPFSIGGWCSFGAYKVAKKDHLRVLVDNRTQGIPNAFYREVFDLFMLRGRWQETLSEWRYDFIVLERSRPLASLLAAKDTEWKKVYEEGVYVTYQRRVEAE